MDHWAFLETVFDKVDSDREKLKGKATGKFYTHELIGSHLVKAWIANESEWLSSAKKLVIGDPFSGDGRLLKWAIEAAVIQYPNLRNFEVHLWDIDETAVQRAKAGLAELGGRLRIDVTLRAKCLDAFRAGLAYEGKFDLIITNPPWEHLKPDARELLVLPTEVRARYVEALRTFDRFLAEKYPVSQPKRKFAGWGTNLARAGTELAVRLVRPKGIACIVSPASLFADDSSDKLRNWLFRENSLLDAAYFPSELRLFAKADVTAAGLLIRRQGSKRSQFPITKYTSAATSGKQRFLFSQSDLQKRGYTVPISFGLGVKDLFDRFATMSSFGDLKGDGDATLWAGREVDETRLSESLSKRKGAPFLKGRMVGRYQLLEQPNLNIHSMRFAKLRSVNFERIAWRDVSRPNQKRRMIATLIPSGWVTGNSLSVAYFRDSNGVRLRTLLGLMNSLPFEAQLRGSLATGHLSLTSLRTVRLPSLTERGIGAILAKYTQAALDGFESAMPLVEAAAAHAYGLSETDFVRIMSEFPKLDPAEREVMLNGYARIATELIDSKSSDLEGTTQSGIPNHYSATLSELDLQTAIAVPPGGNWKNIPDSIPLKRLTTIRESFARGEGSRSTYYGRLHPDRPAYTINTYFSRPGNGCHLHYDFDGGQHRVISQREAARLQTFPDGFEFFGSKQSISQQIGNAVPPLLAYCIANHLPGPGCFVDLFAGAGGLSLGFAWAGWTPLVANEIEASYRKTYVSNLHPNIVLGDIRSGYVVKEIVESAVELRKSHPKLPLWVIGGPPCQGFSTAGKKRSIDDERNHLFRNYIRVLELLNPDGFVFENVTGLLNMEGGSVFQSITAALRPFTKAFGHWVMAAEEYGIPQRRTRVVLVGTKLTSRIPTPPAPITSAPTKSGLFSGSAPWVTTNEALCDLPPLKSGEDGSSLSYSRSPRTSFQAFVRGQLTPKLYLERIRSGKRQWP